MAEQEPKEVNGVDFKEYVKLVLVPLERDLAGTRNALEKLAVGMVSAQQIDTLKLQVSSLSEGFQELEKRIVELERDAVIYRWFFRVLTGFAVTATGLWLYRSLGL